MELLAFKDLTWQLGEQHHRIMVSGAVQEGAVLLVRGPSGAGKSTLLRVLARLTRRQGGKMWLAGQSAALIPATSWRRQVHYFAQRPVVLEGTIRENIMMPYSLAAFKGEAAVAEYSVRRAMEGLLLDSDLLDRDARTLSGGELARLALLRAALASPALLLLDEPTGALDREAREAMLAFLRRWLNEKERRGLVLVSHLEDDARSFPRVATLELGRRVGPAARGGVIEVP